MTNIENITTNIKFKYPSTGDKMFSTLKSLADVKSDSFVSEIDKVKFIIGYAHSLFGHDGNNTPSSSDPLTILKEAKAGKSFRCVEYSTLAAGLLWAYGVPARTVGLKTRDVETREYGAGHVVIEFWSSDYKKWIMCDVQAGVIPKKQNLLLSAYELKKELDQNKSVNFIPVNGSRHSGVRPYDDKKNYKEWIREYLYFIDTPIKLTLGNEDKRKQQIVMLVPKVAQPPIMFQGMFKMNATYTNSVSTFYPSIKKSY